MARKSKPWAVVVIAAEGVTRTEHTSEAKTYEKVRTESDAARAYKSTAIAIRVEQWEPDGSRWALYDLIDPQEQ